MDSGKNSLLKKRIANPYNFKNTINDILLIIAQVTADSIGTINSDLANN